MIRLFQAVLVSGVKPKTLRVGSTEETVPMKAFAPHLSIHFPKDLTNFDVHCGLPMTG